MVKHVEHLPGDGQKRPLSLLLPGSLAGLGEVAKVLPAVARLATHKFLVSVHAVVGLKLLGTTVAVKHMAIERTSLVRWQRYKSLVTDITRSNLLCLFCVVLVCFTSS